MKTRWLLVFCLCILLAPVLGQDILILRSGEELKVVVKEIGVTEIKYLKFDNQSGPQYSISKEDVFMIKYQNGTSELFNQKQKSFSPAVVKTEPSTTNTQIPKDRIRKTKSASTMGYLMTVPIMMLGVASANADTFEEGIPLGAAATIIGGVSIPIIAGVARRTRNDAGVSGSPGIRTAGWIAYGLALGDAVYLLALSGNEIDASGATVPVAILGSAASIFMAIDAGATARQAEQQTSFLRNVEPYFGRTRIMGEKPFPTIGIRIRL